MVRSVRSLRRLSSHHLPRRRLPVKRVVRKSPLLRRLPLKVEKMERRRDPPSK
jgi:hypothetical protein